MLDVCRFGYQEELIGFITARICLLHECNPTDRALLNLNSARLDGQSVLYILTLGVLESVRQQGIGSALLRIVLHEVNYSPLKQDLCHIAYDWPAPGASSQPDKQHSLSHEGM